MYNTQCHAHHALVGLKNGHMHKHLTQNGEPQRDSCWMQKQKKTCSFVFAARSALHVPDSTATDTGQDTDT